MDKKEKWYLLSNKDQITSFVKYNNKKLDSLSAKEVLMVLNETKKAKVKNQKKKAMKRNSLHI